MSATGKVYSPAQQYLLDLQPTRVAYWCGVSASAVSQWLVRRPPECPVPPGHLPRLVARARAAGEVIDLRRLWPDNPALPAEGDPVGGAAA